MLDLTNTSPLKVVIGSPIGENIKAAYLISVMGLMGSLDPSRVLLRYVPSAGSNIAENQNCIVDAAEKLGADYVFLIENDMGVPKHALVQLLSHQKDVVGCTYAFKERDLLARKLRGENVTFRMMGHEADGLPITLESLIKGEPLRTVNFIPMGCTLISMTAINAVRDLVAQETSAPEGKRAPAFFHNISYPLDNPRGVISTTDSSFCHKARDAGVDVWLDARLSLQLEHIGDCAYGLIPDEQKNGVHQLQDQLAELAKV